MLLLTLDILYCILYTSYFITAIHLILYSFTLFMLYSVSHILYVTPYIPY